jgi:hypothetical protein
MSLICWLRLVTDGRILLMTSRTSTEVCGVEAATGPSWARRRGSSDLNRYESLKMEWISVNHQIVRFG